MTLPWILLAAYAAVIAWQLYRDRPEYRAFKALTDTKDRQRVYVRWLIKFFLIFGVGALVSLALLGDLRALLEPPAAFAPLMTPVQAAVGSDLNGGLLAGFGIGLVVAIILATIVARMRAKRSGEKPKTVTVGDIQPLLPRNAAERRLTALLSLNAGFGEELFFRLAMPLVLAIVTGNALLAFVIATLAFGALHLYQGWIGVVAASIVGAVMAAIYLATGSIWVVVILHAAIDLNGLVLMPYLAERRRAKT